jgi:hypothetical protein
MKIQNITFDAGLNVNPRILERSKTGKAKRTKSDAAVAIKITPPGAAKRPGWN